MAVQASGMTELPVFCTGRAGVKYACAHHQQHGDKEKNFNLAATFMVHNCLLTCLTRFL
jgi:hypothetical protein